MPPPPHYHDMGDQKQSHYRLTNTGIGLLTGLLYGIPSTNSGLPTLSMLLCRGAEAGVSGKAGLVTGVDAKVGDPSVLAIVKVGEGRVGDVGKREAVVAG